MFESFSDASASKRSRKGLAASTMVAAVVYAGAGSVLVAFATTQQAAPEKVVEVSFEKLVPKKNLPPPPPPPPKVRRVVAAVAAPQITELIAPKEVPKEKPPEQDPSKALAQGTGDGTGIPGAAYGSGAPAPAPPPPPPPPPKPKKLEAVNLPEEAEAPVPDPGNTAPGYPEAARAAGIEGRVILKIVISEAGQVTNVTVMRGDPLLAQAAVEVVKNWKFSPATLEGKPIAVFRIVPINFSSKVGGAG